MICEQALWHIDHLPAREWRPALRAQIQRHIAGCEKCRQAFDAAQAMEAALKSLAEVTAPAGLDETIAIRTSQHAAEQAASKAAEEHVHTRKGAKERRAWAAMVPGAALAFGAQLYIVLTSDIRIDLASAPAQRWLDLLITLPQAGPSFFVLAAGLALFTVGLFALPTTDKA